MSLRSGVVCIDCRMWAPKVGDDGFLGGPTLEPLEKWAEQIPSFGYLYGPLSALGIRPYDLEEFREWLDGHGSHRLHVIWDLDDLDACDLDEIERAQLNAILAELADQDSARLAAATARRKTRMAAGEFKTAIYELTCSTCEESYPAARPELLRAFDPSEIKANVAKMSISRWADRAPDEGWWNSRLYGIADPYGTFLSALPQFLTTHLEHRLVARLRPMGGS